MEPTLVSRLSSNAPSAIAILVIDGPNAIDYVLKCWRPSQGSPQLECNRIRFGFTFHPGQDHPKEAHESIVVCRTNQHRVELHCHGGKQASERILNALVSLGAVATPWTQEPKLLACEQIAQEATQDLVRANTARSTAILMDQFRGALSLELDRIRRLKSNGFSLEALVATDRLTNLFEIGRHLIQPWRIVLAGPPNVGKSSLLNRILGYQRAIVHEQAGTTRDALLERTSFDGWPIEIADCAGVRNSREAASPIETEGIERTLEMVRAAECVLLIVDVASGWTGTHTQIYEACTGKRVLVRSKNDLSATSSTPIPFPFEAEVTTSALTGEGLLELQSAVVTCLVPEAPKAGAAVPFRPRHLKILEGLNQP